MPGLVEPPALTSAPPCAAVSLFGIRLHAVAMPQAVSTILGWLDDPAAGCRYVVTPNIDHLVQLAERADFRAAYASASLVLADGWPVVAACRLLGRPLPGRVAGSDLVPALLERGRAFRLFLLGAAPGVAARAGRRVQQRWPHIRLAGCYSPPVGFEHQPRENQRILAMLEEARPDVLLVGLGAPRQELWTWAHHSALPVTAALCVGATIDFLAGQRQRAPRWMRRSGLEWCYRMLQEPRRLGPRYARDAWIFPQLVWRQWRS